MTTTLTPNAALGRTIKEARWSYAELAAEVRRVAAESGTTLRTRPSAVAYWLNGGAPTAETAGLIAEALSRRLGRFLTTADLGWSGPEYEDRSDALLGLGIGPDPVDIVRRLGEADINRRQILTTAAYSVAAAALPLGTAQAAEAQQRSTKGAGRYVGRTDLDTVRAMIRAFAVIDERQGGQHGRSAVVQYLRSDVAEMTRGRFATEALRAEALTAAAALSFLAGWKAFDADEHGLSQRYHLQSLALAREAGNPLHAAWILRLMAHKGMDIRQPAHTLDLAEAAVSLAEDHAAEPGLMATLVICRARALGHAGRGREAAADIRRAQDLALRAEDQPPPYWMVLSSVPTAQVNSHTGKTLQVLKDYRNAERGYARAARVYNTCAPGLNRVVGLSLADQGSQQAAQGHLEQACGTWNRALTAFEGVFSDRAAKRIGGIQRQLASFERRGVRAATQLDERIRTWQLAHA